MKSLSIATSSRKNQEIEASLKASQAGAEKSKFVSTEIHWNFVVIEKSEKKQYVESSSGMYRFDWRQED